MRTLSTINFDERHHVVHGITHIVVGRAFGKNTSLLGSAVRLMLAARKIRSQRQSFLMLPRQRLFGNLPPQTLINRGFRARLDIGDVDAASPSVITADVRLFSKLIMPTRRRSSARRLARQRRRRRGAARAAYGRRRCLPSSGSFMGDFAHIVTASAADDTQDSAPGMREAQQSMAKL